MFFTESPDIYIYLSVYPYGTMHLQIYFSFLVNFDGFESYIIVSVKRNLVQSRYYLLQGIVIKVECLNHTARENPLNHGFCQREDFF
jgi:hypothetical protein